MKSKRFLVDNEIAPIIQDLLYASHIEFDTVTLKKGMLKSLLKHGGYSALILQSKTKVPTEVLDAAGKCLKVIGVVGDSLGNINVTDASRRGILVKAAEYVNAYEVANLTLNLIVRMLSQSFQDRDEGQACLIKKQQDIYAHDLSGFELAGATIGLIGCGGRGTGAVLDAVGAATEVIYPQEGYHTEDVDEDAVIIRKNIKIAALADLFEDRLNRCNQQLSILGIDVPKTKCFSGMDAVIDQ